MAYRGAVLFDLDGTLVDTAADFVAVIHAMLRAENLPLIDERLIRNTVSEGARGLIRMAFNIDETHTDFENKRQTMLDLYEKELGKAAAPFAGFRQLLAEFEAANLAWGVVTNKPWRFSEPLMQALALFPSENIIICPDHVTHTKPNAEPLLLAAQKLNLTPTQCIYAGDHLRDIQAAQNAGMFSIACAFGYIADIDNIHDWNADRIVQDVAELGRTAFDYFKN